METLFDGMYSHEFLTKVKSGEPMKCPCCQRLARVWRHKLHVSLAYMLVMLYKRSNALYGNPYGYVHVEAIKPPRHTSGRNFCIAKHWGLIEQKPHDGEEARSAGMWSLTAAGKNWVEGKTTISKYAFTFDDKVLELSDEQVSIHDVFHQKFDWKELMAS